MALPVAPPPKPNDVAVLGWAGLTVRIAWTLLAAGVKVRPDVLRDARNHVLYQLDPAIPLPQAEDLATRWVEAYVARARGRAPHEPWPADWEMPLSPRWRKAIGAGLGAGTDAVGEALLRKHYGDGRSLSWLENQLNVGRAALESQQAALREAIRKLAVDDGLPLDGWDAERIDRLLRRLAAWAPPGCPQPLDVAEGCHREHVAGCPRCDRLQRLLRAGVLSVDDLFPPTVGARPTGRARVLAVQVHPAGRAARRILCEALPTAVHPVGDDLLLMDGAALDGVDDVLRMAAEVGLPARDHLRGALIDGPGTWTTRGLVGPLPERVAREVVHRSWGSVDGIGVLPEVLPEPPSARRWWLAAAALLAAAAGTLALALAPPPASADRGLEVAFTPGRGGVWVAFDAAEPAVVTLLAEHDGAVFPVLVSRGAADKAAFATGDGRYRVHVASVDAVLVVATDAPLSPPELVPPGDPAPAEPLDVLASKLSTAGTVRAWRQ